MTTKALILRYLLRFDGAASKAMTIWLRKVAFGLLTMIAAALLALTPMRAQPNPELPAYENPGAPSWPGIETRELVPFSTTEKPGTIIIKTDERNLYFVQDGGMAFRYRVGVGSEGKDWYGVERISRKAEWPDWRPPAEMLARWPSLPTFVKGGPGSPMGSRALYLGATLYRIHGTNNANSIGTAVTSGCIRMSNVDVEDLYERVDIGAKVIVSR